MRNTCGFSMRIFLCVCVWLVVIMPLPQTAHLQAQTLTITVTPSPTPDTDADTTATLPAIGCLPQDLALMIGFTGGANYEAAYRQTALHKVLSGPEWERFLRSPKEAFAGFLSRVYPLNNGTFSIKDMQNMAGDSFAAGIGQFEGDTGVGVGLSVLFELSDVEIGTAFMDELVLLIRQSEADPNPVGWLAFETSNGRGWTLFGPGGVVYAGIGVVDRFLVLFGGASPTGTPLSRDALIQWMQSGIANAAATTTAAAANETDSRIGWYGMMDGRAIVRIAETVPDEEFQKFIVSSALEDLTSSTFHYYPDGEGFRCKMYSRIAHADSRLMALASPGELSADLLRFVPNDAVSVHAARFRFSGLLDWIKDLIENSADDPAASMQLDGALAMLTGTTGIDLASMLSYMGDEAVVVGIRPEQAGGFPLWGFLGLKNQVMIAKLSNESAFDLQIDSVMEMLGQFASMDQVNGECVVLTHNGHEISYIKVAAGALSPSLAIVDGHLIKGFNPFAIARILDHYDRPEMPFLKDPDVKATLERVGGKADSSISYRRYRPETAGPGALEILAGGAVIAGIAIPSISKTREVASSLSDESNLRQIGIGIALYADTFGDNNTPPAKIQDILANIIDDPQILRCPITDTPYVYLQAPDFVSGHSMVAFCSQPHPDGTRNVLFLDGSTSSMSESAFRTRLSGLASTTGVYTAQGVQTAQEVLSGQVSPQATAAAKTPFINPALFEENFWITEAKQFASSLDLALLPPARTIHQHQFSSITVGRVEPTETYGETYHSRLGTLDMLASSGNAQGNSIQTMAVPAIIAAIAIPNLLRSKLAANEAAAIGNMRTLASAEETFRAVEGQYTTLAGLGNAVPAYIDSVLASGAKQGYSYNLQHSKQTWSCIAKPVNPGTTGNRAFYVDQSGVIRFEMDGSEPGSDSPPLE